MSSEGLSKKWEWSDLDNEESVNYSEVGERLRTARLRKRLTLKEISNRAQLSESFISQVERGKSNASIDSLKRVATALDITLSELFDGNNGADTMVLRKDERPTLKYGILGQKSLLTPASLKHLEVFIGEFEPDGSTGEHPYNHGDSEELFFVLSGVFKAQVGDEIFTLKEGDSVIYRSSTPHYVENIGEEKGEVMWIISPPSM